MIALLIKLQYPLFIGLLQAWILKLLSNFDPPSTLIKRLLSCSIFFSCRQQREACLHDDYLDVTTPCVSSYPDESEAKRLLKQDRTHMIAVAVGSHRHPEVTVYYQSMSPCYLIITAENIRPIYLESYTVETSCRLDVLCMRRAHITIILHSRWSM